MNVEDLPIVDTVTDLPFNNKGSLLHDLASRAAATLNIDENVIFQALLKREEVGSTGVGHGVAISHARLEQVKRPFGIMARLKAPIDFNAIDGLPVDLVCLLLLSKQNEAEQLQALAAVSRRLRHPEVVAELRRAPNRVILYNALVGRPGPSR
jgi:PTS system nitrogen regulatory IIA component